VFLAVVFNFRGSWVYQRLTFRVGSALIALIAALWMIERICATRILPFGS